MTPDASDPPATLAPRDGDDQRSPREAALPSSTFAEVGVARRDTLENRLFGAAEPACLRLDSACHCSSARWHPSMYRPDATVIAAFADNSHRPTSELAMVIFLRPMLTGVASVCPMSVQRVVAILQFADVLATLTRPRVFPYGICRSMTSQLLSRKHAFQSSCLRRA